MAKVLPFLSPGQRRRDLREQASLWVVRLDAGLSDSDLQALHAWLDGDEARVTALLETAALWDRVSVLSELAALFPLEEQQRKPRRRWWPLLPPALAAAALAAWILIGPPS